jgi:hypothetical protein
MEKKEAEEIPPSAIFMSENFTAFLRALCFFTSLNVFTLLHLL